MDKRAVLAFWLGAAGSVAASLAHMWCVFAGPEAYAFLGAPPDVIQSAREGTLYAPAITTVISAIIFGWALYAMSAIGRLPRLPLLRTGLIAVATVLILRGLIVVPLLLFTEARIDTFGYVSSAICFVLGAFFAAGLVLGWRHIGKPA